MEAITIGDYFENISKYANNLKISQHTVSLKSQSNSDEFTSLCSLVRKGLSFEFCVQLYNYQSDSNSDDPAVLVIVASAQGTSAQVVKGNTKLLLNSNGIAKNFKAQRLSDFREEQGKSKEGEMTLEEKNQNVLFIYQIPLKQRNEHRKDELVKKCCSSQQPARAVRKSGGGRGLERAIISAGSEQGRFEGTRGLALLRDDRFPIRCTVQYYNVTDVPRISDSQMRELAALINEAYSGALATGSLVTSNSNRETEPALSLKKNDPISQIENKKDKSGCIIT